MTEFPIWTVVSLEKQYLKLHKIRTDKEFVVICFLKNQKYALSRDLYLRF